MIMRGHHLYLRLYHGRKTREEDMQEWGTDGPTFGPLDCVHGAYLSTMQVYLQDGTRVPLPVIDDFILWDGVYYGDFVIFTEVNRTDSSIRGGV